MISQLRGREISIGQRRGIHDAAGHLLMVGVSLHQPNFIPWTKLMAKIVASDVYVAYDSVQFTRTEYHNRQRLRARHGSVLLTASGAAGEEPPAPVRRRTRHSTRLARATPARHRAGVPPGALLRRGLAAGPRRLRRRPADARRLQPRSAAIHVRLPRVPDDDRQGDSTLPHSGDNTDRLIQLTTGGRRRRAHHQHLGYRPQVHRMGPGRRRGHHDPHAGVRAPDLPPAVRAVRAQPRRPRPALRRGSGGDRGHPPIQRVPVRRLTPAQPNESPAGARVLSWTQPARRSPLRAGNAHDAPAIAGAKRPNLARSAS